MDKNFPHELRETGEQLPAAAVSRPPMGAKSPSVAALYEIYCLIFSMRK